MEPHTLNAINAGLAELLWNLNSADGHRVTPGQVADLLVQVLQVGEWLPTAAADERKRLERELDEYSSHLEGLRTALPVLQLRLQIERARLESERSHLRAAMEWTTVSRETF